MSSGLKAEKHRQPSVRKPEKVTNARMRIGRVRAVEKAVLSGFPRESMSGEKLAEQLSAARQKGGPYPSEGKEMTTKFFGLKPKPIKWIAQPGDIQPNSPDTGKDFNWIDPDVLAEYEERGVNPYFDADVDQVKESEFRKFFAEDWQKPEYDFLRERWAIIIDDEDAYIRVMGKTALWLAVQLQTTQELIEEQRVKLANGEA